jgi:hypothetical protein
VDAVKDRPERAGYRGCVCAEHGGTVKENREAQRANRAFQRVLDAPGAAAALENPVLEPLLDEAAD